VDVDAAGVPAEGAGPLGAAHELLEQVVGAPGGLPHLLGDADRARDRGQNAGAGSLRPVIGQRFPLAQAAAAHRAIEAHETVGKTILIPSG